MSDVSRSTIPRGAVRYGDAGRRTKDAFLAESQRRGLSLPPEPFLREPPWCCTECGWEGQVDDVLIRDPRHPVPGCPQPTSLGWVEGWEVVRPTVLPPPLPDWLGGGSA